MSQEIAKQWSQIDQKIKQLSKGIELAFWEMIGLLRVVYEHDGWVELGYSSFDEYLAQEELAFERETVEKYIRTKKQIDSHGDDRFFALPRSKVALIAPHLDKGNKDDLYHKAKSLSWRDLRTEIQETVVDRERPPRPYLSLDYNKAVDKWRLRLIKNGGNLIYEGKLEDYLELGGIKSHPRHKDSRIHVDTSMNRDDPQSDG